MSKNYGTVKTAKEFPSGINRDPGINLNGPTNTYDTEEAAYPELSDEEEVGQYKEYDPQKGRFFDIDFLSKDDDSYKEIPFEDSPEAPLDNFDGDLSIDQVSSQYPRYDERWKPVDLHSLGDNTDAYDEYEMHMMAKKAQIKTANIIPGDTILIMRPHRYLAKYSKADRVAKVIQNLENGWLMVQTMRGEKIAVYAGSTDEDDDVQKLNFDFLEQIYKNKIGSKKEKRKFRIDLLQSRYFNEEKEPLWDQYSDAIDEDQSAYLEQNYDL